MPATGGTLISTPSPLQLATHWRQQYVTQGLNKKLCGIAPAGVVRGGKLITAGVGLFVTVSADPDSGDSIYSYVDQNGQQITFRQVGSVTMDLLACAGTTVYLCAYVDYTVSNPTVVEWRAYLESEIFGGAPVVEAPYLIIVGRVTVPLVGPIPPINVTNRGRREAWMAASRGARDWRKIIDNGSFEFAKQVGDTPTTEPWPDWDDTRMTVTGGLVPSVVGSSPRTGDNELQIALSGAMGQGLILPWSGRIKVRPGQLMRIGCWVRGSLVAPGPNPNGGIGVLALFYNNAGGVIGSAEGSVTQILTGTFAYREISRVIAVPANADLCEIGIVFSDDNAGSTGAYFIDDVQVWLERGKATDEYPDADEHRGSIRARTIDVGHPTALGVGLSDRIDRVIRFRQGIATAPLELHVGARGNALQFTMILSNGALSLGGDLSMNGHTIEMAGGTIEDASGDIQLNGDTEVTGSLHATNALSCDGSVLADASVIADANASGTGEFWFGLPVDRVLYLGPEDGVWTDFTLDPQTWLPNVGALPLDAGPPPPKWSALVCQAAGLGQVGYASFPIHIPSGAIIRQVDLLTYQIGANQIVAELLETNHDWTTPTPSVRVSRGGPWTNATAGSGYRVITSGGINVTLTEGRGYAVLLKGMDAAHQFFGMKITYRYTYLRPMQ